MKNKLSIFSLGLALFTMLFGAGNIIFPLILGRETGSNISYSMIGFLITAVVVPILGLSSAILFEGDYKKFLSNIGKLPSTILIFICMLFIIGPLGATTRCFILSYSALQVYMPSVPIYAYTAICLVLIYLLSYRENKVVDLLGTVLGPIKITLLVAIIIIGVYGILNFEPAFVSKSASLKLGLEKGYFTLDLIGTIFFAHLIYDAMKTKFDQIMHPKKIIWHCLKAGFICALLLGFIYFGFGVVSAAYSSQLVNVPDPQLLSILSIKVLGEKMAILSNIAVAVATFITATALITLFSDYLTFNVLKGKITYNKGLIITMALCLIMVNLEFEGIMKIISPIAIAIYPALIVLSIGNILNKLVGFKEKYVFYLVWVTFGLTIALQVIVPLFK